MAFGKKLLLLLALAISISSCSNGSSTSAVELRTVVVDSSGGSGNCDAAVVDAAVADAGVADACVDAAVHDAAVHDAAVRDAAVHDAAVHDAAVHDAGSNPCTFTQGYWKNHPEAWPVTALTLGSVTYTQAQLLAILSQPVKGNGLVALARQLIAAKLNIANGAGGGSIAGAILAADALINGLVIPPIGTGYLHPSTTSGLVGALDGFNNSSDCD